MGNKSPNVTSSRGKPDSNYTKFNLQRSVSFKKLL